MSYSELIQAQLTDPFRIALLIGLVLTMRNTRHVTGMLVPALAGVAFVAVLIPMTLSTQQPFWPQIWAGLISNAVILAAILGLWRLAARLRG